MVDNKKSKLDKETLLKLMAKADAKWYNNHSDHQYNYREHLEFTADYITKNYDKGKTVKISRHGSVRLL